MRQTKNVNVDHVRTQLTRIGVCQTTGQEQGNSKNLRTWLRRLWGDDESYVQLTDPIENLKDNAIRKISSGHNQSTYPAEDEDKDNGRDQHRGSFAHTSANTFAKTFKSQYDQQIKNQYHCHGQNKTKGHRVESEGSITGHDFVGWPKNVTRKHWWFCVNKKDEITFE